MPSASGRLRSGAMLHELVDRPGLVLAVGAAQRLDTLRVGRPADGAEIGRVVAEDQVRLEAEVGAGLVGPPLPERLLRLAAFPLRLAQLLGIGSHLVGALRLGLQPQQASVRVDLVRDRLSGTRCSGWLPPAQAVASLASRR